MLCGFEKSKKIIERLREFLAGNTTSKLGCPEGRFSAYRSNDLASHQLNLRR
jgi:hypothetical protein